MTVAAVPNYMGNSFTDAPPGHRFGLYFDRPVIVLGFISMPGISTGKSRTPRNARF